MKELNGLEERLNRAVFELSTNSVSVSRGHNSLLTNPRIEMAKRVLVSCQELQPRVTKGLLNKLFVTVDRATYDDFMKSLRLMVSDLEDCADCECQHCLEDIIGCACKECDKIVGSCKVKVCDTHIASIEVLCEGEVMPERHTIKLKR